MWRMSSNSVVLLLDAARFVGEDVAGWWFIGRCDAPQEASLLVVGQVAALTGEGNPRADIRHLVTFRSDDPELGMKGRSLQDVAVEDPNLELPRVQKDFAEALLQAVKKHLDGARRGATDLDDFPRASFIRLTSEG